jgi:amidohydrolase
VKLSTAAIRAAVTDLADSVREHRRAIHRRPELAFAEHETAAYIESVLDSLGIPHHRVIGTGVVAEIRGRGPRAVGVRADMDALPVLEAPGRVGYRSEIDGVSHACGHDGHVAVLLGLAELLCRVDELPGTVMFYFQPAEETTGGAQPMVDAGVLDEIRPDAILGLHVSSSHPAGVIGLRHGPVTGSDDVLEITVHGTGGHAAHPHTALDPVPIAAEIVLAAQRIVTREVAPVQPALITFGTIHGGTKPNVIPETVHLGAVLRAVDPEVRDHLVHRVWELAQSVAATHRATATVTVQQGFAPGANDPIVTDVVGEATLAVLGADQLVWEPAPSLGAEDFFAFGSTGVPVCMFRLGIANPAIGIDAPHHSPEFDLDEGGLPAGVAVFAESIRRLLTEDR